jgi:hypothetical protein
VYEEQESGLEVHSRIISLGFSAPAADGYYYKGLASGCKKYIFFVNQLRTQLATNDIRTSTKHPSQKGAQYNNF